MRQKSLTVDQVLSGYDAVSRLYPYVPSLSIWRSWEYAAYQSYQLPEPVLDVGCGDGRFFRLVWPRVCNVVGVDSDVGVADAARGSGVYREVFVVEADRLSVPSESFASAFANCSLEHVENLPGVLKSVWRSMQSYGEFVLSVVTDKFQEWTTQPRLVENMCDDKLAHLVQSQYESYHHLLNAFPASLWQERLEQAGFEVMEWVPIMPEMVSRLFLFLDQLWHVPGKEGGELGDVMHSYLTRIPSFPQVLRQVLEGLLQAERDWSIGSGAVFLARKKQC